MEVSLCFVWHMHQPFYKDLFTEKYFLPWVLLHSTKDYFDMAFLLKEFEGIKQTFNLVPSLLLQLQDYERGEAKDIYLEIFRKDPKDLSKEEKIFILKNFFNANWENMIKPYPRYYELLKKRGFYYPKESVGELLRLFTREEIRDIQVLFFLCWFDPSFFESFEELKELKSKGKNFTEEDKLIIEKIQKQIIGDLIPLYKELHSKGTIELSTSPFYHPILPLLIDSNIAKISMPEIKLPERAFRRKEDASKHIELAIEFFLSTFGIKPKGMWPPEGSVSDETLELFMDYGIEWTATDEEILFLSLNMGPKRDERSQIYSEVLHRPYRYIKGEKEIKILFRDKQLSDLISFHYYHLDAKDAAKDFINRIKNISRNLSGRIKRPVITIVMDGENAWEYYKNDGRDFLSFLYEAILKEEWIRPQTVTEFLKEEKEFQSLHSVFPGSWISHNFSIWIGHPEDNKGWELLSETRDFLEKEDPEKKQTKAWQSIYIAQGSDWFWWYGDEHSSENDEVFDFLFRLNLSNVYRFLGKSPPEILNVPIILEQKEIFPDRLPLNFISPKIDGYVTDYFEWLGSGLSKGKGHGIAMHETSSLIKDLYYGFDKSSFYIRLDIDRDYIKEIEDLLFEINIFEPKEKRILYSPKEGKKEEGDLKIAFGKILELKVPLKEILIKERVNIKLSVSVKIKDRVYDRIPNRGYLSIPVPEEDFEKEMWYV